MLRPAAEGGGGRCGGGLHPHAAGFPRSFFDDGELNKPRSGRPGRPHSRHGSRTLLREPPHPRPGHPTVARGGPKMARPFCPLIIIFLNAHAVPFASARNPKQTPIHFLGNHSRRSPNSVFRVGMITRPMGDGGHSRDPVKYYPQHATKHHQRESGSTKHATHSQVSVQDLK